MCRELWQEPLPPRTERTGGREELETLWGTLGTRHLCSSSSRDWDPCPAQASARRAAILQPSHFEEGGLPEPPYLVQNQVVLPVTQRGAVRSHQLHKGHGENPLAFVFGWERQKRGEVKLAQEEPKDTLCGQGKGRSSEGSS